MNRRNLLSAFSAACIMASLFVSPAMGATAGNCPTDYEHTDLDTDESGAWGSITVDGDHLDIDVNSGWTVFVCLKAGSNYEEAILVGPGSSVLGPLLNNGGQPAEVSHYNYSVEETSDTTTTTEEETSSTTTTSSSSTTVESSTTTSTELSSTTTNPSTTTTDPGTSSTTSSPTSTSTVPSTLTTQVVGTTVPGESTTTQVSSITTQTLPFTGAENPLGMSVPQAVLLALGLLTGGAAALLSTRGRES